MNFARFAILLAALALAACAGTTPYRDQTYVGGFNEARLNANTFRVSVQGNVLSSQAETDEMALLRSAEVARTNGFGFFASSNMARTGSALGGPGINFSVPASTLTIVCFKEKPETDQVIYNADEIFAALGRKYHKT